MANFRDQARWTSQDAERLKQQIAGETSRRMSASGFAGAVQYLDQLIVSLENIDAPDAQLKRLIAIIAMLDLHEQHGHLSSPQIGRLTETAMAILKVQGVTPETSKLSFLYGDLHLAIAHIRRKEGRHFDAAWQTQIGRFLSKRSGLGPPGYEALVTAQRALRMGDARLATEGFTIAENSGLSAGLLEQARLGRIQALRLAGRTSEAHELIDRSWTDLGQPSAEAGLELAWENFCLEAQTTGNLTRMVNAVARSGTHRHPTYILEASLWVKSVAAKNFLARVPKAESIRRLFAEHLKRPAHYAQLYECALVLDRCYDNAHPLVHRLTALGQVIPESRRLLTIDKQLLVLAGAIRFLVRYHQPAMAAIVQTEYRALSMRLSDGADPDILSLGTTPEAAIWSRLESGSPDSMLVAQSQQQLPSTGLSRAAQYTRLSVGLAATRLKGKIRRAFAPAEQEALLIDREFEEMVQKTLATLGSLKGPAAKVGQMLAYLTPGLSDHVRRELSKMNDSAPPLANDVIRKVVETELGAPVSSLFAAWSDTPLAAASIGQIHRARLHDGRDVVVKVQYPGVVEAVAADLKLVRMMASLFRRLFPQANVDEIIEVSEHALLQECDYLNEAAMQSRMREHFGEDPEIYIPEVMHELSTGKVLAMEYIDGQRFYDFRDMAGEEDRQWAARVIYRFCVTSYLRHNLFNADPHPGNFLIMNDRRICFLDFGFTTPVSRERAGLLARTLKCLVNNDREGWDKLFLSLGYVVDPAKFNLDLTWELCARGSLNFQPGVRFRYSRAWVKQVAYITTVGTDNRGSIRLPVSDAMLPRFLLAMHGILADLEGEEVWYDIFMPLVEEAIARCAEGDGNRATRRPA